MVVPEPVAVGLVFDVLIVGCKATGAFGAFFSFGDCSVRFAAMLIVFSIAVDFAARFVIILFFCIEVLVEGALISTRAVSVLYWSGLCWSA